MGLIPVKGELETRQTFNTCDGYGYYYDYSGNCYYSGWNAYGRWVLLAVIVIGAFLLFLIFSCITARRRRRLGRNPYPLTGWANRPPPGQGPAYNGQQPYYNQSQGYNQQQGYSAPPPAYGQQQYGVAPQQPGPIYQGARGGENVYDNDQGKKDNVVR
ncbi:hypothetical protein MMC10_004759 [Thelotrema lepadinum]|nr:hypothetical protein [Thelotrema lepadinum]